VARRATVQLGPIVAGVLAADPEDEITTEVLDTTAAMIGELGLTRWSVDDVAARSGLGRTTIYRRFDGREHLVHAVIARELRRFFTAVTAAVSHVDDPAEQVVEGMLVGLRAARGSLPLALTRSDAGVVLPMLTTAAGPVVDAARDALVALHRHARPELAGPDDALVADALVRLSLSYLLTPPSGFDLDDDAGARAALRRIVVPLLGDGAQR
jgi:AcrR family transcriptional regulator